MNIEENIVKYGWMKLDFSPNNAAGTNPKLYIAS
tara:strand:+ start:631 stop:732 length:102 start_codon:yes stop_codon:yes gene_type:complete